MRRIHLTRIAAFSPFPRYLTEGGMDVERLLTSMGVAPESLTEDETLFPFLHGCRIIDLAVKKEHIPQLGLEVGATASMSSVGLFGSILCQSLTLNDLLKKFIHWLPAVNSGAKTWMEPGETPETINLCLRHNTPVQRANIDGFALLLLIDAVRMGAGLDWRPKKIRLDAAAGDISKYEALSDAAAVRNTDHLALEIPRSLLSRPVTTPELHSVDAPISENQLHQTAPAESFVGTISQAIKSGMGTQILTIEQSAELANMSVRTLQRRLKTKGLVYRELVDRARFKKARHLLNEAHTDIGDIARHLGYSDPANFNHAFQRWTGTCPTEYRASLSA